jgi:hypothetical protein
VTICNKKKKTTVIEMSISVNPTTLAFSAMIGGPPPTPQTLSVTSSPPKVSFTVTTDTTWLLASAPSGITDTTITVSINDVGLTPATYTGHVIIQPADGSSVSVLVTFALSAACIHQASLIQRPPEYGHTPICELKKGDIVLGPAGQSMSVVDVVPCWLKLPQLTQYHTCVLFAPQEYALHGNSALKPAIEYNQPQFSGVTIIDWNKVAECIPGPNFMRYDLVLPEDSCGVYLADGLVIQGRKSILVAGYHHAAHFAT